MKIQLLFLFLIAAAQLSQAATSIQLAVHTSSESPDKTSQSDTSELTVLLGDSKIEERSAEAILIRDFEQQLTFVSQTGADTLTRGSLFQDIGFRTYEFQNRLFLGGALAAANIADNPMPVPYSEHLFSLRSDKSHPIDRKKKKGNVTFSYLKNPLFSYSLDGKEVDPATAKRFILFLRYRYGIHPDALDELQALRRIPNTLTIYRRDIETTKITLETIAINEATEEEFTNCAQSLPPTGDPLLDLTSDIQSKTSDSYKTYCAELLAAAIAAAENNNDLESVCLFLGYTLATGEQLPASFRSYRDRFTQNLAVQELFASINPQSKEAAEAAVISLTKFIDTLQRGRSVALIFRANIQTSLKLPNEAIADFTAALNAEPMIVGAWKDLGDLYFQSYNPQYAWACWAAARSLNPNHNLLATVAEFETELQTNNPDFFL